MLFFTLFFYYLIFFIDLSLTYTFKIVLERRDIMLINEVAKVTNMTKRAIKYYEEKKLIFPIKDKNGYRNYSQKEIDTLNMISLYRKLGISIEDIRILLSSKNAKLLDKIYQKKLEEKTILDKEISALKSYIEDHDVSKANKLLDYATVIEAIETLIPGKCSFFFKEHFRPFLNISISSDDQKSALNELLDYCDITTIKIPLLLTIGAKYTRGIYKENRTADEMISFYRDMSEEKYQELKEATLKGIELKEGWMKYHPSFIVQRKVHREFQNKGYNDIFIPLMKRISPKYREYKEALDAVNERIQEELGIYYDSNYNLKHK